MQAKESSLVKSVKKCGCLELTELKIGGLAGILIKM